LTALDCKAAMLSVAKQSRLHAAHTGLPHHCHDYLKWKTNKFKLEWESIPSCHQTINVTIRMAEVSGFTN